MHRSFHLVLILVTDGRYLADEDARKLLWLCKNSYYERELLRAFVDRYHYPDDSALRTLYEKIRHISKIRYRRTYNNKKKSLLTPNIFVQNELRVDLLLSVGCKPSRDDFTHAVQLGRFDMVDKMVATLDSPSDITVNCRLLKSFGNELNTEHFRRFIASPHVRPYVKLLISMVHESMIDVVKEALDAVTEDFADFSWPETEEYETDDPLQLEAEGWVWVGPGEFLNDFLGFIGDGETFNMRALKLVYSHPLISNNDVLELTARNSDPRNARLAEFREWACGVVDDTMYGPSTNFPSYLVYAASCFNMRSRVEYLMTHGGDANSVAWSNNHPIIAAARNEHADMVRLLGRYADVDVSLFAGAYLGLIDVVEMQLDVVMEDGSTIDVNTTSRKFFVHNETPLLVAAAREHAELVRYLLARGATALETWVKPSANSFSFDNSSLDFNNFPLISLDMLRVLLDGDCDPSVLLGVVLLTHSRSEKTHWVRRWEREAKDSGVSLPHWRSDAVKLCLEFGAEVTDDCMLAACSVPVGRAEDSSLRLLFELRDLSAVVNCEVDKGRSGLWSPLRVSMELANFDTAMLLLQRGAVLTAALFEQISKKQKKKDWQKNFTLSQQETLRSYVAAGPGGATAIVTA